MRTAQGNVNMVAYGKINTRLSPPRAEPAPLTYIHYWTEHSSTGILWPLQPQRYLPYGVSCNGLVLFFICCRNLEQTRVYSSTALSTLRPQIAMVWSNCFIFSRNLEQSRVDNASLPLAAFQRLDARSSNLYRSVTSTESAAVGQMPRASNDSNVASSTTTI